jgi:hypothetical protein
MFGLLAWTIYVVVASTRLMTALHLCWPSIPIRQAARGYDDLSCGCQW